MYDFNDFFIDCIIFLSFIKTYVIKEGIHKKKSFGSI